MKLYIFDPLGNANMEGFNIKESMDGRNIETTPPCHWLFGGFRNRKVDPLEVIKIRITFDLSEALQKQAAKGTVFGGNDGMERNTTIRIRISSKCLNVESLTALTKHLVVTKS